MEDWQKFMMGSGFGGLGAGLGSLFGSGNNPADAGMKYLDQIPDALKKYFEPYMNAGQSQLPGLQDQYSKLLNNPGQRMNDIGQNFQQSPGFKFALDQALKGANQGAAAGGMAGSPQNQQQNMEIGTQLGNQDYNNWMKNAMNMYGMGLQGSQGLAGMGQQASTSMADQIAQMLAAKSQLGYSGAANQNQMFGSGMGDLFSGLGMLGSFFL
jgi:hypothetical protein